MPAPASELPAIPPTDDKIIVNPVTANFQSGSLPKVPPSPDQEKYRHSPVKQRIDAMKPVHFNSNDGQKSFSIRGMLSRAVMAVSLAFSGSAAETSQHPVKTPYTPPVSESFGGIPTSDSLPVTK